MIRAGLAIGLVLVIGACGGSTSTAASGPPAVESSKEPRSAEPPTLVGAWEQDYDGEMLCFAFCPGGKFVSFLSTCANAGPGSFVSTAVTYELVGDELVSSSYGTSSTSKVIYSGTDHVSLVGEDGATELDRTNVSLTMCDVEWKEEDSILHGDRDSDGVKNGMDMCPDDAEDLDGVDDHDGCPE
jgi:hypothetical protein